MGDKNQFVMVAVQDTHVRKALGARIKALRKQRGWTQKELATELDAHYQLLNKYEAGIHVPPLEKLIRLSEVLETTLDYLMAGQTQHDLPLKDKRLLRRLCAIEDLEHDDQETVIRLVDAMILKHKVGTAMVSLDGRR